MNPWTQDPGHPPRRRPWGEGYTWSDEPYRCRDGEKWGDNRPRVPTTVVSPLSTLLVRVSVTRPLPDRAVVWGQLWSPS